MVDSELDNLTLRTHRRVRNVIGLNFNTTPEQVKKITSDLQGFFEYHEGIDSNESRVRFAEIGQSGINLVIDYFVVGNDPEKLLMVREEVNFKVLETILKSGSELAYPTQTVLVRGDHKA